MNAIDLLTNRQSDPLLTSPAPSVEELDLILAAGMRVPDHAGLQPFHFTLVQEEGLNKLSDIFINVTKNSIANQVKLDKVAKMPFRAPLIIVVSTRYQAHEKVPQKEQLMTAGCCVHAMQLATVALGYGAIWRTGELSMDSQVKASLQINEQDDIAGFLYIGSKQKNSQIKKAKPYKERVSYL